MSGDDPHAGARRPSKQRIKELLIYSGLRPNQQALMEGVLNPNNEGGTMSGIPKEVEVVVIGSGVSGLAAAVTAAEGGAQVVVLEKQRSLGGTSNFFEGIFAVESEMQRERYITYSRDEAFKRIMDYSHWRADARLVRAFVDESGPTISWLLEKGVEFSDATINMPESPPDLPRGEGYGCGCC